VKFLGNQDCSNVITSHIEEAMHASKVYIRKEELYMR
jgi:hypothetical protein